MSKPMVNVCMVTYNHEKYIAQAIESVLMQQTSFEVVLLIGEDCSTDGTRAICVEYAKKFPDKVKLIAHDRNVGMMPNFMALLNQCTTPYIALLDGDDYWTDSSKLQQQVDFMETNAEYVLSFHDAQVMTDDGNVVLESKLGNKNRCDASALQLKKGRLIPTSTVVFRNVIKEYPGVMARVKNGDAFLWALLGQYGEAKFFVEIQPSGYRQHSGGVYSYTDSWKRMKSKVLTLRILKGQFKEDNYLCAHYDKQILKLKARLLKLSLRQLSLSKLINSILA